MPGELFTGNFRQLNSSNVANLLYTSQIAAAYRRFAWLVDPDFATQNEPEAWQKIRRDADIQHAIMKRRQAVAGLDWGHDGVEEKESDKLAAEWMDWNLSFIRRFHFSRFNLNEAIFRGSSWAFIEGDRAPRKFPGDDRARTIWAPRRLRHVDRFRFRLVRDDPLTQEAGEITTRWEFFSIKTHLWTTIPKESLRFFIRHDFEQTEDTLGYGRGLLQSIFYFWRAKSIVLSQGLAGLERWAQGLVEVAIDGLRPGDADRNNDAIVDEWIDEYNKQRTQHVLVHDARDKILIHDMPAKGADQVMAMYDRLQSAIDRLILTSTLPTGGGDSGGSLARATVEQEEMDATFQADRAALSETLDETVSKMVWERNLPLLREFFADKGFELPNRPRFKIRQRKINDPERNSKILETALRAGVPVKARQAYELLELEQPADDDDVIAPMQGGPPPAGGLPGLPFRAEIMKLSKLKQQYANGNSGRR